MKRPREIGKPRRVHSAPATVAPAPRAPVPPAPAPPAWRDPWAWACALAVIPIVLHSLGAPLGEPVAEDFDFLHRALFSRTHALLDGGGSNAFWRPLAHQVYYQMLAPLILDHPSLLAALHTLLLALATVLLYRAFHRGWPAPWAAAIATFPLLSESTRALISWPSHFVDLGVWLFTALVIHEAAARRLWTALVGLLAALLCKEVALVAAVLVPWLPGIGPRDRRERLRWAAAMGAVAIAWGAAYWVIRQRAGLHLPHELETSAATTPLVQRFAWAVGNSVRACFSLPSVPTFREGPLSTVAAGLVAIVLVFAFATAGRRRALAGARSLGLWGLVWFLAASATFAPVFPYWAPIRSSYGSLGVGAIVVALFGAAHSWLLGAVVLLRLAAFALSPAPPATVSAKAPETGAFLDFERLVRLQRLVRETRHALGASHPTLPAHAGVGLYNLPHDAEYAYGGSQSLQAWYRDSTLHWVHHFEFVQNPDTPMVAIAEFELNGRPQFAIVRPEAMRSLMQAMAGMRRSDWERALADLDRADSLAPDPNASQFRAQVAGNRAVAQAFTGRIEEAEREAKRGLALWPLNSYAHYALGVVEYRRGNLFEAAMYVDTVLRVMPNHPGARMLAEAILAASHRAADSLSARRP